MRQQKISLVFVLIALVFCLLYRQSGVAGMTAWRLLTGGCIAIGLLGAMFAAYVSMRLPHGDATFLWTRRSVFAASIAMLGAWYVALYPGAIIGLDTSMMLSSVVGKDGYSPFSAFWNNFFGGLYALTGTLQVIPVFNILLCAWTVANLVALNASMGIDRYLLALVVFLLFALPTLPSSVLLWSHDTTAALLRLALVSYVMWLYWKLRASGKKATWGAVFIVSALAVTCGLTRSENFLLVLAAPAALLYYRVLTPRMALSSVVGSMVAIVLFSGLVERQLYKNESKIDYSLSLLANPARYFYNNDFVSDTASADRALLEQVFDRDWLRGERFPYAPYNTRGLLFKSIDDATMQRPAPTTTASTPTSA
jgi:hypothetical protein